VARKEGELPHPVEIRLPKTDGLLTDEGRVPGTIYCDDFLPKTADHHTVLGAFVDGWGRLEFGVSSLMTILAGTDTSSGNTIFRGMGMRQVIDTIMSLATRKLDDGMIEEVENLLDRLAKINGKRNTIVH
jgi:hypothetical protein